MRQIHFKHVIARDQEPAIQIFRVLFVWTSTKNEWNAENTICSRAFGPSIARTTLSDHARFDHLSRET